ncbi:hypothetical protein K32_27990 [Kaistia sp. 32K]|uniref:hypothetical protein n=1 Tax=Kaistia sp. 32K TaxID=2795690 RepID=UPI0019158F94|nr:hypothetical protein [Kaistia sp. 32K]BCP54182.1 hypothetical protein K32_27990 [Kaistia sp. 32K]
MSIIHFRRSASLLPIALAAGFLALGVSGAQASNAGSKSDPSEVWEAAETPPPAAGMATQQSSASAWSESDGDHGMSVTTTQSGDSTSCMVVEWKRENGGIKRWQYRCDTARP